MKITDDFQEWWRQPVGRLGLTIWVVDALKLLFEPPLVLVLLFLSEPPPHAAVSPNVAVADTADEGPLPDEDENAAPADLEKKATPPDHDEQLQKAIEVLKHRQG